jgi:hypothetical protein
LALPGRRMRGSRAALSVIPVVHREANWLSAQSTSYHARPTPARQIRRQWNGNGVSSGLAALVLSKGGREQRMLLSSGAGGKKGKRKGNDKNRRGQGELSLDSQRVAIRLVIPVEASTLPCLIEPIGAGDHHGGGGSEGPGRSFEARRRALITLTSQICGGGLLGVPLRPQARHGRDPA